MLLVQMEAMEASGAVGSKAVGGAVPSRNPLPKPLGRPVFLCIGPRAWQWPQGPEGYGSSKGRLKVRGCSCASGHVPGSGPRDPRDTAVAKAG